MLNLNGRHVRSHDLVNFFLPNLLKENSNASKYLLRNISQVQ